MTSETLEPGQRSEADELRRHRVVGTAGHIDHGKSVLVRRLTGTDPDRLQEEKERGITIDLGFAVADLDAETRVGFVDVPGHERFVKNMLAGIGGIDAVLLVVAADESIMPQTREHLAICRLLEIEAGVVALTKCDLVDREIVDLVELEVREFLSGTPFADAPLVRTSDPEDLGFEELRRALSEVLAGVPDRGDDGPARLPVDRVFTLRGFGTVVTGTLLSGTVATGDELELLPEGRRVRVRNVQVHGRDVECARAGQRTALNLQDADVDDLDRGDVLAAPGSFAASYLLDARLRILEGFGPLENLDRIRFHHGAAEIMGRVALLEGDEIPEGGSALVQLRLESPYAAAPGDRFIVRRYSPMTTIGGGTVVDPLPDKHAGRERRGAVDRLIRFEEADLPGRVVVHAETAGLRGITASELTARLGATRAAVEAAIRRSAEGDGIVVADPSSHRIVPTGPFRELGEDVVRTLEGYHAEHPLRPAMPKELVRSRVAPELPPEVLERALDDLAEEGRIVAAADGHALSEHRVELGPEQDRLCRAIEDRFREAGLRPPDPDEVVDDLDGPPAESRALLHHLLRRGRLLRLRDGLLFHPAALDDLVERLRDAYGPGDEITVGDFKELAAVTRKHAIPLLEHLDQRRVTHRRGDVRELVQ